ncbi:MAG: hypothetical protein RPR97_13470, partial [Colwellia sp.]
MNYLYKNNSKQTYILKMMTQSLWFFLSGALFSAAFFSFNIQAEPYLAIKNNLKCAACHVNPNGGGLRNDFGKIYGQSLLPAAANSYDNAKLAKLMQYLSVGADARFNATFQKTEQAENNTSQSFEISSAQVYINIKIPNSNLSLYVDQQV